MIPESEILTIARQVFSIESQAVAELGNQVGVSLARMAVRIHESRGRVVLTGVGKSAHIARKVSATLNSVGTPSLFMHAADATHGDLGAISAGDLLLVLSKSGNTQEIRTLIPLVRELGIPVLAFVSDQRSYLESQSEITVHLPFEREACPDNLAPTTSTVLQLAMGDALAMVLRRMNEFSGRDFARLHPGGSLGKRLNLTVSDLINRSVRPSVHPDDPIRKVILEISSNRLGATAVTNDADRVVGIITDGDLRRMMEKYEDFSPLRAGEIMTANPQVIGPAELAASALERMRNRSITQLLVMEGPDYLGVIHIHDILREGII